LKRTVELFFFFFIPLTSDYIVTKLEWFEMLLTIMDYFLQ